MRTRFSVLLALSMVLMLVPLGPATADTPEPVTVVGMHVVDEPEGAALVAELEAFGDKKGFAVIYDQYFDIADLVDRVLGEDPPDVILVPWPSYLYEVADELVDLSELVNPNKLEKAFGSYLIDVVSTEDGVVLGAPIKANLKTLVWYKPATFQALGYSIPQSLDELVALSDRMVADGETPWCNYIESGFATGWVGTDWIEDLLLGAEGGDAYDQWVDHTILFADSRVELAFERYQQMIDTAGYVFDRPLMLEVPFYFNALPLDAGDCLMHRQATFFAAFIGMFGADLDEFSTFKFPSANPIYGDATMGGADYMAALDDRKEVEELTRFMLSRKFGETALAATGSWLLPNTAFDQSLYPSDLVRSWADTLRASIEADLFRFDGSDLMPPEVGTASFWYGIVDLVSGVRTIPQVLADIDASWPD